MQSSPSVHWLGTTTSHQAKKRVWPMALKSASLNLEDTVWKLERPLWPPLQTWGVAAPGSWGPSDLGYHAWQSWSPLYLHLRTFQKDQLPRILAFELELREESKAPGDAHLDTFIGDPCLIPHAGSVKRPEVGIVSGSWFKSWAG
jgi:hypothetical protein